MSIPADIASLISDKYKSAFDNGNLKFIQTETTKTKDPKPACHTWLATCQVWSKSQSVAKLQKERIH